MEKLLNALITAKKIILSTHKNCDGDGLGSQLALFYALKSLKKEVRLVNVDETPRKYRFLKSEEHIEIFEKNQDMDLSADLCLIFDTNDERLLEPLFSKLKKSCNKIAFIDHHPLLIRGPQPSEPSWIAPDSASTGEMTYNIIKSLKIPLDKNIARSLYTSITFDTQLYRFIRNSPNSHLIAAELLGFDIHPEEIHRHLVGHHTIHKISFLSKVLGSIEYYHHGQLAILNFTKKDMDAHRLDYDESRDIIDMIMNIETIEAAAILREDRKHEYKISLRSKGHVELLGLAESLGGGGHRFAAGAYVKDSYESIRSKIISVLTDQLKKNFQ